MDSRKYVRLNAAFLAMAEQSSHPDIQTRWRRLAQACQNFAKNAQLDLNKTERVRSHKRTIGTRITSPLRALQFTAASSFWLNRWPPFCEP